MNEKINISEIILKLCPNAEFVVYENNIDKIEWHSSEIEKPSRQKILDEIEKLKNKNNYELKRKKEYPNIIDQLDMIYWDSINGTQNWVSKISEIKEKYPKSE